MSKGVIIRLKIININHNNAERHIAASTSLNFIIKTLRKLAVKNKLKVNEYGVWKNDKRLGGATEKELYNVLTHLLYSVKEKLLGTPSIIIHLDKKLQFINSDLAEIFPGIEIKHNNETMSSAAASIINRIEFDNWLDEMSNKYSLKMIKSNLNEINNLDDREKLIKVKYVKNKKRNENNKF